jgi:hypothetical protein
MASAKFEWGSTVRVAIARKKQLDMKMTVEQLSFFCNRKILKFNFFPTEMVNIY